MALLTGLSSAAWGLSRETPVQQFRHTAWLAQSGVPTGGAVSMAQTTDGFLWISSFTGLARFDGLQFEQVALPADPRRTSSSVYSISASRTGGLWVSFAFGGLGYYKNGQMRFFNADDGLPPRSVRGVVEDAEGHAVAGTDADFFRLVGDRWEPIGNLPEVRGKILQAFMQDSDGTLWACYLGVIIAKPTGETFRVVRLVPDKVAAVAQSPDGAVWASVEGEELIHIADIAHPDGVAHQSSFNVMFDRDGAMWRNAERGLERLAHPEKYPVGSTLNTHEALEFFATSDGLSQAGTRSAAREDREGNLWLITDRGLDRFSENNVVQLKLPVVPGTEVREAGVLAGDKGQLYVLRYPDLLDVQDGQIEVRHEFDKVTSSVRAIDGSLWLGSAEQIWHIVEGRSQAIKPLVGARGFEVQSMAGDGSGGVWVSIAGPPGVWRYTGGEWQRHPTDLPNTAAVSLAEGADGETWLGYTENRLAVVRQGVVKVFSKEDGVTIGTVTAIVARRAHAWIGGESGLLLWDGQRLRSIKPNTARAFDIVTGIVETASGDLWLNARAGAIHITREEIARLLAGQLDSPRYELFDQSDGLEGSGARLRPLPTLVEAGDGRLWFATNLGVYSIDPAHIHRNAVPPPVWIKRLRATDRDFPAEPPPALAAQTTSVNIDYVGLSLTQAERVQYKYRLDGVDPDWQEANARAQAFYTNLKPGDYRFRVVASNNDGVWNSEGATLRFRIAPSFYQTAWFAILCGLMGLVTIGLLFRLRLRQLSRRLHWQLSAQLAERDRIARELHDTLLQSTQGLVLQFHSIAKRLEPEDANRAIMVRVLDHAEDVMAECRNRVLDLRGEADGEALSILLSNAGARLCEGHAIRFTFACRGAERALREPVRDELVLVAAEAMSNVVRHAGASALDVEIDYRADLLIVEIRDDGKGIDPRLAEGEARAGHWGLPGMRERAARLAGTLSIENRPGGGTLVRIQLPLLP
jgi:signal transduction histidine kinase/ligand-binding sensor domain-containing protein